MSKYSRKLELRRSQIRNKGLVSASSFLWILPCPYQFIKFVILKLFFIKRVKRSVALNQLALNQLSSRSKFTRVEQYNSISYMEAAVMEVT